jgi:hypothetical protein
MVEMTTTDDDSMTRLPTARRQLTSDEIQQARHHARKAINEDSDVVDWTAKEFEVSTALVNMALFHVEFSYAHETGCTWLLEAYKPIERTGDSDGLLTIIIEYLPNVETVETVRVRATA